MCGLASSTHELQPNKVGLKCPSAHPYVRPQKVFFDFTEIWYVGRGRRLMHDGMQYELIQGQGHEPLKVRKSAIIGVRADFLGGGLNQFCPKKSFCPTLGGCSPQAHTPLSAIFKGYLLPNL